MTHAHDRTLLSSLGFSDRDKSDRRHYLACRYVCEESQHLALTRLFVSPSEASLESEGPFARSAQQEVAISKGQNQYKTTIGFVDVLLGSTWREKHKADSHDVRLREQAEEALRTAERDLERCARVSVGFGSEEYYREKRDEARKKTVDDWHIGEPLDKPCIIRASAYIAVEVKIVECGVDSIIRQIALYREYPLRDGYSEVCPLWVAATLFPLSSSDVLVLKQHGIGHVVLGAGFASYCAVEGVASGSPEL